MKRVALLAAVIGSLAGCVTSPPRLVNQSDASVEFSKLGSGGRSIAQNFYNLGAGDTVKRLYWSQRNLQQNPNLAESTPVEKLQRRYVQLPSPPYQDSDGTLHEASIHAVEIVQFIKMVPSHGRKLFIVK